MPSITAEVTKSIWRNATCRVLTYSHSIWILRIIGALFGMLLRMLLAGFIYEQIGRAEDAEHLPRRLGQAIDIGGPHRAPLLLGPGHATVVFETGGNDPGSSWALIQPRIAAFTRACWYDRAGVGWSDPPPTPRTSTSVISDLHATLQRAGEVPPYVIVGASIGGEDARIYTARYPADVAGSVFVDATNPDQQEPPYHAWNLRTDVSERAPFVMRGHTDNGAIWSSAICRERNGRFGYFASQYRAD